MPAFEWVHVQLHQQKGMISLSPPTICNSAQSTSVPSAIQGSSPQMADMNQHEQAIISHKMMNNGSSGAHQKMVESHQNMMGGSQVTDSSPATSFKKMDEHEKAAVAHEFMNNGQSGAHQAMAEKHRAMSKKDK
ncbi:copper-binding protein [Morganella morganii]|uniref:copper-binding protein n=1 Tax=Morganella morganii TaxID=582 RepID=UPI003EC15030